MVFDVRSYTINDASVALAGAHQARRRLSLFSVSKRTRHGVVPFPEVPLVFLRNAEWQVGVRFHLDVAFFDGPRELARVCLLFALRPRFWFYREGRYVHFCVFFFDLLIHRVPC